MSVDLILKNGFIVNTGEELVRSIAIHRGKIEGIYNPDEEPDSERIIDCNGQYVLPGLIDIHVHLRGLLKGEKEDYASGTRAAAAGGITTVVDMPNSSPPVLDMQVLQQKINEARDHRYVNVGFYSGVPEDISGMSNEVFKNVLGLKVYPHDPLDEVRYDNGRIQDCLRLAKKHGLPLMFHPDDTSPEDQAKSMDEYFLLHSCEQEVASLMRFIEANEQLDCRLHVCHVSCGDTVDAIVANRQEDLLTAEVTPHHLLLSRESVQHENGATKMLPPLRSPNDGIALRDALLKCQIDIIASDHAPHTSSEKTKNFVEANAGIPGLETMAPLLLTEVFDGKISWVELLRLMCSGPANILRISGKGILSEGYDADIAVFSKEDWIIRGDKFHSKAKITPFEGYLVKAKPAKTIVGGQVVYNEGKFEVQPGVVGTVPVRNITRPLNT